jgi:hypothetical protein
MIIESVVSETSMLASQMRAEKRSIEADLICISRPEICTRSRPELTKLIDSLLGYLLEMPPATGSSLRDSNILLLILLAYFS